MFRTTGRKFEAEAALRAATRADPTCEQGRSEAAIDCLRRALQAAPDYADAMFNLAVTDPSSQIHTVSPCYRSELMAGGTSTIR